MGKSPGKWIKTLFSGKKSSKSNPSGKRNNLKPSSNQDVLVSSDGSMSRIPVNSSLISTPTSGATSLISPPISGANGTKDVLSEKVEVSRSSNDRVVPSAGDEDTNTQAVVNSGSQDDVEKNRLAQAAIKAQAAFRGYQARREFQTLKGIIQLQALIRGRLVRRQAVSTLYCVKGIVKLQALVRGHKVRRSDIGIAVLKISKDAKLPDSIGVVTNSQAEKLSKSVFAHKLLGSSSSTVSLHLNPEVPNFAWEWLDRWTRSHFWEPLPKSEKKLDLVSSEKSDSHQIVENNESKVKRNAQKASGVKVDESSISDSKKHKRPPKTVSGSKIHSSHEHSPKEVKSNTKSASVQSVSNRSETTNEKRKPITGKLSSGHAVTDVSEHGSSVSVEKVKNLATSKANQSDLEKNLGKLVEDEHDKLHDNPIADLQTSIKKVSDDVIQGVSEDLNGKVNSKNSLRRASLPANFDNQENGAHNTPSPRLPSYMAPTESAKAKLRAQGSPRFATELVDKNGIARRHSLSSSFNGKLGSFSPRAERLLAMSSRGLIRTDRSLSSSRDGTGIFSNSDKLIQPQWRR